jgi:bifunctional non-homologous end joining protein LigD
VGIPSHVFGRELRVTNFDKVLFPARAASRRVTKQEFLAYTARIARSCFRT